MTEEVYDVTLLADHKGIATAKVHGDEYYVDALVDVSTYDASGVVLSASDFGLSRVTAVTHTGTANVLFYPTFVISAAGAYTSTTSFTMLLVQALQATPAEVADGGTHSGMQFRLRVYGLL
tara:strand:+ start:19826 stop:20188 length:363 start_codon:yes stop_codon:yes gene_type:complete